MTRSASKMLADPNPLEGQIELFEKEVQEKYCTTIQNTQMAVLTDRLNRLLEVRVVPTLGRIGFDEQLCWALFTMTASAWELIEPFGDNVELMYPNFTEKLGEIRRGILSYSKKNSEAKLILGEMDPQTTYSLIKSSMHPAKLCDDFNNISLSWIILPRAYDLLEKDHSHCMLIYIQSLDQETETEFTKILARIIIEFLGNYSLKYMDNAQLRVKTVEALFYGYSTMFWKNLNNPPDGLEDGLVFENFYRWAKTIHRRFAPTNRDMERTTERMEEVKGKIFPICDAFGFGRHNHNDAHSFLIALRHGIPGVESVVRYFGVGRSLLKDKTDGRLPYVAVPKRLSALFRLIKRRYHVETPRTKKSIREVLSRLGTSYNSNRIKAVFSGGEPVEAIRFVGPRVSRMIQDLDASIH
jgi:hypothetical protein